MEDLSVGRWSVVGGLLVVGGFVIRRLLIHTFLRSLKSV